MRLYEGERHAPALLADDGTRVDYGQLPALTAPWRRELDKIGDKGLAVLFADPDVSTVGCYLACLATGTAVLIADPGLTDAAVTRLAEAYRPDLMLRPRGTPPDGYRPDGPHVWRRTSRSDEPVYEDTAVLMTTSGSTGAPRAVRLSYGNIETNANAIADGLGITAADRAITSLPPHYCYGLSVLNSHLVRGAPVVLTAASPTGRRFWQLVTRLACTSFAGVPLAYEALLPMLSRHWPPTLRSLTQAGGALLPSHVAEYARLASEHEGRFFVMYGQTEATARISILDSSLHPDRIGTVGRAIPGGRLRVESGEVVYTGPNVMLGYADSRADLAAGDQSHGTLRTGDLGTLDADGFLTLRGRIKRIAKIAGRRISLDEVEQSLGGGVAAVAADSRVVVYHAGERDGLSGEVARLCSQLGVPTASVRLAALPELPTTGSHKIDYPSLAALAAEGTP
jgi:long-chain acyl-CoA synthetase